MIVVSDTSCISGLFLINQARLLGLLYGTVIIPNAVWDEFLTLEKFGFTPLSILKTLEIQVQTPKNLALIDVLKEQLDPGESEAIVLAKEIDAQLLLLDERQGTTIARRMGLKTTGILGVLLEAKEQGLIQGLKPLLADLRIKAGFWLSDSLEKEILKSAGEWP